MVDVVEKSIRSRMMAGIKNKNTQPEIRVRKQLHAAGYRFRLNRADLPGKPDVVMSGRRVVVFVHGCFWHAHKNCGLSKIPATRSDFWKKKLTDNAARDERTIEMLRQMGWRVLVVWECFVRACREDESLRSALARWLEGVQPYGELSASQL